MSDNTLAAGLAIVAAAATLTVISLVKRADHRRALRCFVTQACPHCLRIYGEGIADSVNVIKYHWLLAPRHTIGSLGLPRKTYLVICPACHTDCEFLENGRRFIHPQMGVLDFTRVGKSGTASGKSSNE